MIKKSDNLEEDQKGNRGREDYLANVLTAFQTISFNRKVIK